MQILRPRPTSPRRILGRIGVVALAVTMLTGASVAAPAAAAEGEASWDVATVDGSHGTDRPNYDYAVDPGDRLDDAFVVVNNGSTPIDLELYAADAFTTDAGHLDLRTHERTPTGVGAWLELQRERISLEPGASAEVPFTVTVPDDVATGSHLGGIVATPATSTASAEPERRVGIRMHLRVGDGFRPNLSVEDLSVDYSGNALGAGIATVSYTVRNTGDSMLAAEQSVAVTGPFDSFAVVAKQVPNTPRLLPGETWPVSVAVDGVTPAALLAATVTVVPLYTDPAGSTGPLAAAEHTANGWAIPWLPLLLILGLGALVAVVITRKLGTLGTPIGERRNSTEPMSEAPR